MESAFAVHELSDGHRVRVGALTLTSRAVAHGVPAFAVRVEAAWATRWSTPGTRRPAPR